MAPLCVILNGKIDAYLSVPFLPYLFTLPIQCSYSVSFFNFPIQDLVWETVLGRWVGVIGAGSVIYDTIRQNTRDIHDRHNFNDYSLSQCQL